MFSTDRISKPSNPKSLKDASRALDLAAGICTTIYGLEPFGVQGSAEG